MKGLQKILGSIVLCAIGIFAQPMTEITGWQMQDTSAVAEKTGEGISAATFTPTGWYKATVPGTVLTTLEDQAVVGFTDLYKGTNLSKVADIAKEQRRYWYRSTFNVSFTAGQRVWLDIEGINYQAYIFVNGKSVATMLGAFKGGKFDITDKVTAGSNCLAIKIRGNYSPGSYHTEQLTGSCGSNGGVMTQDGPSFVATQGWDWIPTIPDRSMGIWKPVYIRVTGPVVIRTPWIKTTNVVNGSTLTGTATIPLQITLVNSTGTAVSGSASANIDGTTQFAPKTVSVPANGATTVNFTDVVMTNPKLWWPNGYGDPNLYTCNISFTPDGGTVSDTSSFQFGVRQWSYSGQSTSFTLSCNGKRILVRGGNWGMDDAMKRWNLHKLENKVRYHKEMNFNMIRDWIGMTDNEPFYQFCDKYGMIVWSDFWQPYGPGDGPEPVNLQLFKDNELDKILRVRNHACIAVWCARNETTPNPDLLTYLQDTHSKYDNTRWVQATSGSGGVKSGGPYSWTAVQGVYDFIATFHTEYGSQAVPSIESVSLFLPTGSWPISNSWSYHNYCQGNQKPADYTAALASIWGTPADLKDFTIKAQLMNYDEHRAAFESLQAKRFSGATGLLLWMSNCVWPSMVWQTYDYFMEGTGAMYGSQKGSEPIHIQFYSVANKKIQVINNTANALTNYTLTAETYNLDGTKVKSTSQAITVSADGSTAAFEPTAGSSAPYFLDLKLKDAAGKIVSKNFYWLPNDGTKISNMLTMGKAALKVISPLYTKDGQEDSITFKLVNTSNVCAVACRLLLKRKTAGTRILPVHYNDNYFSLAPGDTQDVKIQFDKVDRGNEEPTLSISGINVADFATDFTVGNSRRTDISVSRKTGITAFVSGNNLKICNLTAGKPFTVTMIDMKGQTILTKTGLTNNGAALVPASVRSGAYVATVKSENQVYRTMVTISEHAKVK